MLPQVAPGSSAAQQAPCTAVPTPQSEGGPRTWMLPHTTHGSRAAQQALCCPAVLHLNAWGQAPPHPDAAPGDAHLGEANVKLAFVGTHILSGC